MGVGHRLRHHRVPTSGSQQAAGHAGERLPGLGFQGLQVRGRQSFHGLVQFQMSRFQGRGEHSGSRFTGPAQSASAFKAWLTFSASVMVYMQRLAAVSGPTGEG